VVTQTICKTFTFEAAHVVPGHPQCGNIHGHTWRVDVFVKGEVGLHDPNFDYVIDFGELKKVWQPIFDKVDHSLMLQASSDGKPHLLHETKLFALPGERMPTSENLSNYFANTFRDALPALSIWVRVWEGLTSWAESE